MTKTERDLPPVAASGPRVVVVEDDPPSADVLQRRLEANGMTVAIAHDGASGLLLVRELRPDLVLLDVALPDTNGYDVCLQLKSDRATADIPVIFLTARGDVYDKVRGLSSGAADYVTKPWHPAELLARIDAVLRHVEPKAPRLVASDDAERPDRPTVAVVVSDPARRARIEALLARRFAVVAGHTGEADLVLAEDDADVTPATAAAVIRLAANGERELARLDGALLRVVELAARYRRLRHEIAVGTEALIALALALEAHDRSSRALGQRVAARAVAIARVLGLDESTCATVRLGALLRDIGNARLPADLLAKVGELDAEERATVERHPILGQELLADFSPLAHVLPIIRKHHEHLDGSGYPDRARADQIPLEVRVVTVADRFEALLAERADRAASTPSEALRVLQVAVARGQLDAAVVAALGSIVRTEKEGAR